MTLIQNDRMKLIVGLGNPGEKYTQTRHNVGFVVVDEIARNRKNGEEIIWKELRKFNAEILQTSYLLLAKPLSFMNKSGETVAKIATFYNINASDIWVLHDDLDIALGEYKIQFGKGPRIHNGVLSVEQRLGTKDFWRVRIGVENRSSDREISGEAYVLKTFAKDELESIKRVVKKVIADLFTKIN